MGSNDVRPDGPTLIQQILTKSENRFPDNSNNLEGTELLRVNMKMIEVSKHRLK